MSLSHRRCVKCAARPLNRRGRSTLYLAVLFLVARPPSCLFWRYDYLQLRIDLDTFILCGDYGHHCAASPSSNGAGLCFLQIIKELLEFADHLSALAERGRLWVAIFNRRSPYVDDQAVSYEFGEMLRVYADIKILENK